MTRERIQRRIDQLLDEADQAMTGLDWQTVSERARAVLAAEPENGDGKAYLAMAERGLSATLSANPATPAAEVASSAITRDPASFANGRYVVKRFLGEGGKKRVYLAHDATLDRDVAFALIKTDGLDGPGRQRITREAQAMGRLGSHPNIVSIFDIGQDGESPYLVQELMGGGDVEGLIEKAEDHKLDIDRAIQIAIETCAGLEFAHAKGIIHRDLKPGNVWLTASGTAKIGDFGLAVAIDRSRLTQAGMMVGTVNYMPPEQAMGGAITPQSDLYSLGAMLYEMVCGRPPFVGDESVAIIGQHLNTPPVAPSWHRHDCPPALEALILRLLEKDPAKRPDSAAEVRQALGSVVLNAGAGPAVGAAFMTPGAGDPTTPSAMNRAPTPDWDAGPDDAAAANPLYRTTFVGRGAEVKALQSALDTTLSGNGGLVMVAGEPGIGKTALCEQLITYAGLRGAKALVGHCYEEGSLSLPYLAFVEAIRSYVLAREPDGLKSDMGSGASEIARIVTEVRDRVSVEVRAPGDPEDDRWRLLQAVSSFLRNASTVQPIVVLLEDLHWADRGTLDLLLHVARNLQGARLLIVGNYRDVEVDRAHPLANILADLRRINGFQRIPLRGLTVDEVARMMANIRGQEANYARAEAIHRQTEGNPLFIQEVLRYLVEEGITVRRDGRYAASDPDTFESSIPEGLREVVGKRLSHLSEKSNQVLTIAAVIGRDFRLDVLQKLAGLGEEDLYAALEEASGRAIIEQRQSPSGLAFRFTHAFFRQTLYEEIFVPRRIRVHQQVGRALEEVYGTRLDDHAAELAEHYAQSTETADLEKAVRYSELAAERSMTVFAYGEAVRLLEQALRAQEVLDPGDKAKRCDLLLGLMGPLIAAGEAQRAAQQIAERAFMLSERMPMRAAKASRLALEALYAFGGSTMYPRPEFRLWAERLRTFGETDSADDAYASWSLSQMCWATSRFRESASLLNGSLTLGRRLDDWETLGRALQSLSLQWRPGDLPTLNTLPEEFAVRLKEGNLPRITERLGIAAMNAVLLRGDRRDVDEIAALVSAEAPRTGFPTDVQRSAQVRGLLLTLDGDLIGAVEAANSFLDQSVILGIGVAAQQAAAGISRRPLVYLGRGHQALTELGTAAQLAESREIPGVSVVRPLLMAHAGQSDQARVHLARVLETFDFAHEAKNIPTPMALSLLEAAVLLEDSQLSAGLTEQLSNLPPLATGGSPALLVSPTRLLGAASALLGRPSEAREYYNQALEVGAKIRFRPEIALTRLGLAELLLEHYPDEHATAIEHLDFAIAEFREMKMQPSLERALSHRGLLKA